eukprot:TRINITY_DN75109_c0_g1_i1.p1 TRINITY_DN75109_c0_g1~~TRINITY_DN75109_c0_g1_i1.p1  ORF type:complete len:257 (+),score=41.77 TRINITY_DN75109_c0_g1_i1:52-822(+)
MLRRAHLASAVLRQCFVGRSAALSAVGCKLLSTTAACRGANLNGKLDVSAYYAAPKDAATKDWVMQQTMYRVKDPVRSLDFYTKVLGMRLITVGDFPQWGFTVYFVGYPPEKDLGPIPENDADKFAYCMKVPGCVELTWNHGSEAEDCDPLYNTGNSDTAGCSDGSTVRGGFGHIGITVPDVYAACQRFKDMGAEFKKSPNAGGMKGLAFIKDPDGYLIEVLPLQPKGIGSFPTQEVDCCGVTLDGGGGYQDNSKK